jgi:peptidylamidoglycolate lyase
MTGNRRRFFESAAAGVCILANRSTRAHAEALPAKDRASGTSYQVVHGWPVLPEGFAFGQVSGVGVDSHNQVFVFHRAYRSWIKGDDRITVPTILVFDGETGRPTASLGANLFVLPHGLRVDRHDNIWVTDLALQQVIKLSHDGKVLMRVGVEREAGCDGRHFDKPTDVAVSPDGSFYVSDGYGNSRVAKFSPRGEFLFDWGKKGQGPGEFDIPHNVVLDHLGRVYVADRTNARIQVFKGDGSFLYAWKAASLGRPWGLDFGRDQCLYVVDGGDLKEAPPDRGRILKLNLNGTILEKWSRFGNYDGEIYWGHDIAVGKNLDVYVGDVYHGMRVQRFTRQRPA